MGMGSVRGSWTLFLGLCAGLAAGCAKDERETALTGGGADAGGGPTGAPATGGGETGSMFDLAEDTGELASGCRGVDFLFVIDSSGSMNDEQEALVGSVPGFVGTIQDKVVRDYHIMTIEAAPGGSADTSPGAWPRPWGGSDTCGATVGAGKITGAMGESCGLQGEGSIRFMLPSQPDMKKAFSCTSEFDWECDCGAESVVMGAQVALTERAQDGECNAGFLRENALLVVTYMTDEEEEMGKSPGDPPKWREDLLAIKGGNETAVVVLGIISDSDQPGTPCESTTNVGGAQPAPRLMKFVDLFAERGLWGSICAWDFNPFFEAAVDIISYACEGFIPQG